MAVALRLTPQLVARVPRAFPPAVAAASGNPLASDEDHAAVLASIHNNRPASEAARGEFWVFAYGSLIWNPGFSFADARPARAHGWHRKFCLGWMTSFRGSPDHPGLMMALDRGGSCEGVAYRLPTDEVDDVLLALIKREMPFVSSGMSARWMPLRTGQRAFHAVGFPINRAAPSYVPHLTEEQVVTSLATASGTAGSIAEYLLNTITHLQANGIHDRALWRLQELVAMRLEESPPV